MEAMENSGLFSVTAHQVKKSIRKKILEAEIKQVLYRPARNGLEKTKLSEPITQLDGTESFRIQSLEKELMHYRCLLDKMVQQKTKRLERRLAILESCNSKLGENYHKIHRMYLDLLIKTQSHETELHQRTPEGELAMLTQTTNV